MDPNSSLGKICSGDDVVVISSDKVEGSGDWNSPDYQDTAVSKEKKVVNTLSFYRIEIEEISERYIAPCFFSCVCTMKVITIDPKPDPFEDDTEKIGKNSDDWDQLLEFSFDDVPKFIKELPPFICKMGKTNRNKKRTIENLNLFYQYIVLSSSTGGTFNSRGSKERGIGSEDQPKVFYKYKVELDRKTMKEEKDTVKRIKGKALKENDDPGAFIFPIRLEGKVNENALAYTGSDINTMPYQIYKMLGREEMKKIDKGIIMINNTQAEAESDSDDEEEYVTKRNRLHEAGLDEDIFTYVAWIIAFNINEPIYVELFHEFYSTYEFNEVCAGDELQSKKIKRFRLGGRAHNLTLLEFAQRFGLYQVTELQEEGFNVYFEGEDVARSLSALIYCRDLDTTTLRDLIDFDGKLIPEDPQLGVPRVGNPRPLRASMEPTTRLAMLSRSMTSTSSIINLTHHSITINRMMKSSIEMT
nr:hypothetical protein [Tanacetum cinerariifolium]